jgi:hypothetical protein
MKTKLTILTLITISALATAFADEHTEKGHVASKHVLTLEGAKLAGEAAAKYAKDNDAAPSTAVVDDGGHLLYFARSEKASLRARTFPSVKRTHPRSSKSPQRILRIQSTKDASP